MKKTETKRPRLEHCPFCGKVEHLEITRPALSFAVVCYSCGCEGPISNTAAGARRAWNRRAK